MKTTHTTVFLSLSILASFLFASSAFAETYTEANIPEGNITTGNGIVFNISEGKSATYGGIISGNGSVTKTGKGELILSGRNTYDGLTIINGGTLTLPNKLNPDDPDANLNGNVTVNSTGIFKCGASTPDIPILTINGGSLVIGATSETHAMYVADFTLSSGYIEFDVNQFVSGASSDELEMDWLKANNAELTSGIINLTFNQNDEVSWHDFAPSEGYSLIEVSNTLTFSDDIEVYVNGHQTSDWQLVKNVDANSIYLKPISSPQPDDPPTVEKWYYANKSSDIDDLNSWTMNDDPKIGVKFLEGDATAEFGTAANPKTIAMNKNGSFTQGEYQIGEGKKLTINATISGDADLLKTGKGELLLNGNNTYTGETIVKQGTLTLLTAGATGTLKPGSTITVDGSTDGTATLNGHGDIFGWTTGAPSKIILKNGGILQNDGGNVNNTHTTIGAVIEMNNGIIQTKTEGDTGTGGVGSYIIDNAIHVTGGTENYIKVREFSLRHLGGTPYPQGEDSGYFNVAEGAKLTISSRITSYFNDDNKVPFVKTGKGVLEITTPLEERNDGFVGNFEIREGTVIGNTPNNSKSAFGYGTLIIEDGALLDCHNYNQFGYGDNVQPNIVVRGTLIPYTDTHMHNVTLEGGTIESENGTGGDGLDFYNRAGTITSSGTSVIKSQLSRGGNITFNVTDGELTISGNNSMSAPMTKIGAGTLKLTNANTSSGAYTIQEGVVVAGNEIALGTGAVTITGDATTNAVGQLTIGETSTTALDLTVSGAVTLNGGQINFDFTANDFDTLVATNGFTFTTGTFNLNFAQGTEATWYENAPEEGYKIVSITNGYTGAEDLTSFLSGRTQPWTLTATSDGIYLGQADDPSSLYWNPISDKDVAWPIDGTEKIGVKYDEDDVKTATHQHGVTLDSDGVFIIGEDYDYTEVGPISGDGDLTKTGDGTLTLSGDNTYTGDTIVSDGTLKLNKDDAIASSGNVTNNATIESTGNQTINNLSGTNPEAEINANGGTLLLNNSSDTQYKGSINGNAKVKKTGFGSLLFTGENTYEGGTEIDEGSLVLLTDADSNGTAGVGPIEIGQNGELVYDVAAGKTKTIANEITGADNGSGTITYGKITKTGAGTLKANTGNTPLKAGSFNVKQGEFDLLGEFEGDLNVGPLDENGNEVGNKAVFSPGNSVGDATVYGDVNIDAKATGLFEFDRFGTGYFDTLSIEGDGNTFTISEDAAIQLKFLSGDAYAWAAEEGDEYQLVIDSNYRVIDGFDYNRLLTNFDNLFDLVAKPGEGLFLRALGAPDMPGVPEPSTWALLLLGVAGLYWMRRRK